MARREPSEPHELSDLGKRVIEERRKLRFNFELSLADPKGRARARERFKRILDETHPEVSELLKAGITKWPLSDRELWDRLEAFEKAPAPSRDKELGKVGRFSYHAQDFDPAPGPKFVAHVKPSHYDLDRLVRVLRSGQKESGRPGHEFSWSTLKGGARFPVVVSIRERRGGGHPAELRFYEGPDLRHRIATIKPLKRSTQVKVGEHELAEPLLRFLFQKRFVPAEREKK